MGRSAIRAPSCKVERNYLDKGAIRSLVQIPRSDKTRTEKGILFILPALVIFVIFILLPTAQTLRYSFTQWDGLRTPQWTGLANFSRAFLVDKIFLRSFLNNALYIVGTFLVEVALGLGMAILLAKPYRGFGVFRTFFFAPYVISMVATGLLWGFIYDYNFGLANSFLSLIGLSRFARPWLADTSTALAAVTIASGWKYAGLYMIIFYAALQQIPTELYEAANLDGASGWKQARYITLPLLFPTLRVALLLCIAGGFGAFALFFAMTNGEPFHSTEIPSTWIIKHAFDRKNMGYGAALTLILTVVSAGISLLYLTLTGPKEAAT